MQPVPFLSFMVTVVWNMHEEICFKEQSSFQQKQNKLLENVLFKKDACVPQQQKSQWIISSLSPFQCSDGCSIAEGATILTKHSMAKPFFVHDMTGVFHFVAEGI